MKLYHTSYKTDGTSFALSFWAKDDEQAQQLVSQRGLGEIIEGSSEVKDIIDQEKMHKLIHTICITSLIAVKSGKMTIDEVLGDRGVLHEAIHILDGTFDETTIKEMNQKLNRLWEAAGVLPVVAVPSSVFNAGFF